MKINITDTIINWKKTNLSNITASVNVNVKQNYLFVQN
jgi:hypothetical protein